MGQIAGKYDFFSRVNLKDLGTIPTPAAGEYILVSSDNSMNEAGQGNFSAYIVGDGTKAATALPLQYINPELYDEQEISVAMGFGVLGWADGNPASLGHTSYLYTPTAIPVSTSMAIEIHNPTQHSLSWVRYFYYLNGTLVTKGTVRNVTSDALIPFNIVADGTFNEVKISVAGASAFSSVEDMNVTYEVTTSVIPDMRQRIAALEENEAHVLDELVENSDDAISSGAMYDELITKNVIAPTLHFGVIGSADGVIYDGNKSYIYTDAVALLEDMTFDIALNGVGVSWISAFYYKDGVFVQRAAVSGAATADLSYTALANSSYNEIRFNVCYPSAQTATDVLSITSTKETSLKDKVAGLANNVSELVQEVDEIVAKEGSGIYRVATNEDLEANENFSITDGKLFGNRTETTAYTNPAYCLFEEKIQAIEFEISSFWDSNLITLVFGDGIDNNSVNCCAGCYLPTSQRPNDSGSVRNLNSATAQPNGIDGSGHFGGDYRQPQIKPIAMAVGTKCRIELVDGTFFRGTYYNTTSNKWEFWFVLDTLGSWYTPDRYGWNNRKRIGFGFMFASATNKEMVKNIRILSEAGQVSEAIWDKKDCPQRNWVAIGDSITQINANNGLSYVGFAQRELGWACDNQGQNGWTIYKLWRDRETAGWETAVSALGDNDVVTILAGTNDFDTKAFSTPASDEAMDAAGNPHPRFGTTDPTSADAKDPHTTLGCLRLMIEDILTLKPNARLVVFSPFYREKGSLNGSTGWNKDLYINSDGKTIYDYADAIYSVAREYNLPAFNTCRDCGINVQTLATYTYDDLHIGQMGGQLIGEYVAKRIRP